MVSASFIKISAGIVVLLLAVILFLQYKLHAQLLSGDSKDDTSKPLLRIVQRDTILISFIIGALLTYFALSYKTLSVEQSAPWILVFIAVLELLLLISYIRFVSKPEYKTSSKQIKTYGGTILALLLLSLVILGAGAAAAFKQHKQNVNFMF